MYTLDGLYEFMGSVIVTLTLLSAVALIVAVSDMIKWRKGKNDEQ